MTTKVKIQKRTEFSNKEVRGMLGLFFEVPRKDKLTINDLMRIDEENTEDNMILQSCEFESDADGYIKDYRLLTSQKKYIGIKIAEDCWVCTAKMLTSNDVKWIVEHTKKKEEHTENQVCKNESQLDLEI